MDNQTMLEKLQTLYEQLLENHELWNYANGGWAREAIAQIGEIKAEIGQFPKAPAATRSHVRLPLDEDHFQAVQAERGKRRRLLLLVGGITLVAFIIFSASYNFFFNTVGVLGLFATIGVGWFYKISADEYKKKKDEYDKAQELYTSTRSQFRKALSGYEAEVEAALQEYVSYERRYYENYPAFMEMVFSYEERCKAAEQALAESDAEIAQNGFITEEYYHLIPAIISMLKSGRADSYKEALNMAVEEERQEANEAARREEEARRIETMERQAEEERRHNMMMEEQQAEHNRRMEQAERDRAEAERQRADQARRDQERAAKAAHEAEQRSRSQAMHRCSKCSKRFACSVKGNPNCGAFDPDSVFKHN